jgi:hypothetical protein
MLSREPCWASPKPSRCTGTRVRIQGCIHADRSRVQPLSRPTDRDPLLRVEYEFQLIAHRFAKMLIDAGERDSEHFASGCCVLMREQGPPAISPHPFLASDIRGHGPLSTDKQNSRLRGWS